MALRHVHSESYDIALKASQSFGTEAYRSASFKSTYYTSISGQLMKAEVALAMTLFCFLEMAWMPFCFSKI